MPRKVWISTTAFQRRGGPTVGDNIKKAARLIDQAAQDRPDLICLPETFPDVGVSHTRAEEVAEPVPGPVTEMAMQKAQQHGTYIICPLLEKRDDAIYNVAVVIDRNGQILGSYEKLHPVTTSFDFTCFERGVTPGCESGIFDLDFGRIGILICFDIQWPEEWAKLKDLGAEIVFWPSAYDGGFPLRARAWDHHYYVVSAVKSSHAQIIDITGESLVGTGQRLEVIGMKLNLDKRFFHTDFNASQIPAIKAKYGREVQIRVLHEEGGMTVDNNVPGKTVQDLAAEFELEDVSDYIERHNRAEAYTRNGQTPPPQEPRRVHAQYV